jgi:hypothetical protein
MPQIKIRNDDVKFVELLIGHRRSSAVFCEKKRCRNIDSNPRNNLKRRVFNSKNQTVLFEFREVFRPTQQQRELLIQVYPDGVPMKQTK